MNLRRLYRDHGDKLRFLIAGVINTAFSYGLFALLLAVLDDPLRSLSDSADPTLAVIGRHYYLMVQWVNWVLCVPPNTLVMKYLAFHSKGSWIRQVGRAYLVYLPTQTLSFGLLYFAVRVLHLTPLLGQLLAIAVALVASYLGHKYFTFREQPQAGDDHANQA
jgi:hypothetical protein